MLHLKDIMEDRVSSLEQKLEEQSLVLGENLQMMKDKKKQNPKSPEGFIRHENADEESENLYREDNSKHGNTSHSRTFGFSPKLEFPSFDGNNPKVWMKKCLKFFNLCKISYEQRVDIASMYLVGKAESWFHIYIVGKTQVVWEEFIIDLCASINRGRIEKC
ncbi:unnamed protein product [Cuscuta epithymum]|uniref:Uncharacterized protein n=1 Tax=Cuscuta epithymum TaxID=186058 RepID=A0AAV0DNQ3_9ASTE|nr:unnamed protein product [Cuscuta epithymum]